VRVGSGCRVSKTGFIPRPTFLFRHSRAGGNSEGLKDALRNRRYARPRNPLWA